MDPNSFARIPNIIITKPAFIYNVTINDFMNCASAWTWYQRSGKLYPGLRSVYKIGDIADARQQFTGELFFHGSPTSSSHRIRYIIADEPKYRFLKVRSALWNARSGPYRRGFRPAGVLGRNLEAAIREAGSTIGYQPCSSTELQKHVGVTCGHQDEPQAHYTDPIDTGWLSATEDIRFAIQLRHASMYKADPSNSFFQSNGQGTSSRENDILAKLFENYRGLCILLKSEFDQGLPMP